MTIAVVALLILVVMLFTTGTTTSQTSVANGRPLQGGRPPSRRVPPAIIVPRDSRVNVTAQYRPRNGNGDYSFRFQEAAPASFRVYLIRQPGRGEQNLASNPHLLTDANGCYVCWTVPITSYEDAKEIAARWAEAVEEFRETGKGF